MSDLYDQEFKAFSESLKAIKCPSDLRSSNRTAIVQALKRSEAGPDTSLPWWQHRVSIPLPVAAAILLIIGLQLLFQIHSFKQAQRPPARMAKLKNLQNKQITEHQKLFEIQYQQQQVYIPGLGTIHSAEIYHFEEI